MGGAKISFIFGGGTRGGPIWPLSVLLRSSLPWPTIAGLVRRSGELLPCGMLLKGALAGIFEGLLMLPAPPYAETEAPKLVLDADGGALVEAARGFRGVGVWDLGGGGPRNVPLRLADCAVLEADLGWVVETGLLGVLDRGGAAFTRAASSSSKYRSPWTKKGRPYSSSHSSRIFLRSASILGKSFAIRLRIFSSLRRRVGSRFSPFCPRAMRREASCDEAARSLRSLIRERCLSTIANVGARCSLSASSRAISASCADRRASE